MKKMFLILLATFSGFASGAAGYRAANSCKQLLYPNVDIIGAYAFPQSTLPYIKPTY
jgi:hypothetical protein